ncbi:MAG TPA: hypothetical protein VF800_31115 [Telluria sp.]|jgi:hypothetical protein
MAALRIDVDGEVLVTVNLDGMHALHVSVRSSLDEEDPAILEVHGGTYGDAVSGHRIWVSHQVLVPQQLVKVSLIESDGPFDLGQTPAEMFPEDESSEEVDFTMTDARAAKLRARPRLKNAFSMKVGASSGAHCEVESDLQNDRVMFMILWDFTCPSQARVSVQTHCVEDVIAGRSGNDHLSDVLTVGGSATCLVA